MAFCLGRTCVIGCSRGAEKDLDVSLRAFSVGFSAACLVRIGAGSAVCARCLAARGVSSAVGAESAEEEVCVKFGAMDGSISCKASSACEGNAACIEGAERRAGAGAIAGVAGRKRLLGCVCGLASFSTCSCATAAFRWMTGGLAVGVGVRGWIWAEAGSDMCEVS